MTTTPELERAIDAGTETRIALIKSGQYGNSHDLKIAHARALIAELLRGMVEEIQGGHSAKMLQFDQGYAAAIAEIRRRAGLEGEG